MGNVIEIGSYKERKPEMVWQCSCGEQLFYILEATGGAQCRTCSKPVYFAIGDERDYED